MLRIGIDIGGTFTDFVVHDSEKDSIITFKLLSDPNNPARTVLQGLDQIDLDPSAKIIHGSTVATNALLERKGACTALVTTFGFKDVIQIARQNRPSLYDWTLRPPPALVPPELRVEVHERIDHNGYVLLRLDPAELDEIINSFNLQQVESVAVCLLFSFLHPAHEQLIVNKLRSAGYLVSASSEILPEYREYERTSTTVVNAYVSPILDRYISTLESALPNSSLQMMQSNGGMISLAEAKRNGARCILSGPAGGIVGAQNIARTALCDQVGEVLKLITFDMGGTSTDVSLIDGQPGLTTDSSVGGYPIHLPMLDIHTIGAGGGSIACVDAGGSLRVGPQSAGAVPGPACYGTGELPTVTDANLVLGRLLPDHFLGGKMQIDPTRAHAAIKNLGASLNLTTVQTALGIVEIVNAQMEKALRVISIERGHDPRDFYLFSFGGAGGLHATELARQMGIPKVIISKYASTLSAFGMLASEVIKDYVKTVMLNGTVEKGLIDELFSPLRDMGISDLKTESISPQNIELKPSLDLRYIGQSYELNIPYSENFLDDFHAAHKLAYGYSYPEKSIEIVNLRVRVIGKIMPIRLPQVKPTGLSDKPVLIGTRPVYISEIELSVPVFNYEALVPGMQLTGPALIVSSDTTILINQNDVAFVDNCLNLIINVCPDTIPSQNISDI
jgi:N-methylhydantoinase A